MKIAQNITKLEVFYDGNCGLCGQFKKWLQSKVTTIELSCIPYASDQAKELFPEIEDFSPDDNLVLRAINKDTAYIYQGEEAWVMCLYYAEGYRKLAVKMSQPRWLPLARRVALTLAKNRYLLSKILLQERRSVVNDWMEAEADKVDCKDGNCKF